MKSLFTESDENAMILMHLHPFLPFSSLGSIFSLISFKPKPFSAFFLPPSSFPCSHPFLYSFLFFLFHTPCPFFYFILLFSTFFLSFISLLLFSPFPLYSFPFLSYFSTPSFQPFNIFEKTEFVQFVGENL